MSIFSCAGWSEAGGPWVKPEMAMKSLVWSETFVDGREELCGEAGGAAVERRAGTGFGRGSGGECGAFLSRLCGACVPDAGGGDFDGVAASEGDEQWRRGGWDGADGTRVCRRRLRSQGPRAAARRGCSMSLRSRLRRGRCRWGCGEGSRSGRSLRVTMTATFRTIADMPGPQGYHGASHPDVRVPGGDGEVLSD